MGKKGQPVDGAAMEEKRQLAKRLLERGLPPRTVARQLGASNSWIYRVRQEILGAAAGSIED
jgi:DNA invertase Pin-like site-specific DNA recombinase